MGQFYFRTPSDIPFSYPIRFSPRTEAGIREEVYATPLFPEREIRFLYNGVIARQKGNRSSLITAFPAGYSVLCAI